MSDNLGGAHFEQTSPDANKPHIFSHTISRANGDTVFQVWNGPTVADLCFEIVVDESGRGRLTLGTLFTVHTVLSELAMLDLDARTMDFAVRPDVPTTYMLAGTDPSNIDHWEELAVGQLPAPGDDGNVLVSQGNSWTAQSFAAPARAAIIQALA